jgi:hypothetical protein
MDNVELNSSATRSPEPGDLGDQRDGMKDAPPKRMHRGRPPKAQGRKGKSMMPPCTYR